VKRHDPDLAGATLAERYRLVAPVGRGAMGAVWRAHDEVAGRDVAIKMIDGRRDGTNRAARFLREGRAMARLHSPHVVAIYDNGRCPHPTKDGDLAFLIMELLEGESLQRRLAREERLDVRTTLRIVNHIARGIALAHAKGIVHRDLKPANVFLTGPPPIIAKVLDFGLAKPLAALHGSDGLKTAIGKPLGTPYYMSPEQCEGLPSVDYRSDLWSLGVITYECLCGRKPFEAPTIPELFARIAEATPTRPSSLADLPAELDAWMDHALAPDVQERFQTASDLVTELGKALRVDDESVPPPRPSVDEAFHTRVMISRKSDRTSRWSSDGPVQLVGRDDLLGRVAEAVTSYARVICLYGERGVGRAAIAEAFAGAQRGSLAGGVWRVPLAGCESARELHLALAAALEATAAFGEAGLATALASLGTAIVIAEDADRVREPLTKLITRVLRDAPQVIFFVTANRPLEAPTERALPVPALATRDAADLLAGRVASLTDATTPLPQDPATPSWKDAAHAMGKNALALQLLADAWSRGRAQEVVEGGARVTASGDAATLTRIDLAIDTLPDDERAVLTRCGGLRGGFGAELLEALGGGRSVLSKLIRRGYVERNERSTRPFALHPLVRRACSRRLAQGRDLAEPGASGRAVARDLLTRHAKRIARLGERARLRELDEAGDASLTTRYADSLADAHAAAQRMRAAGHPLLALQCDLVAATAENILGGRRAASRRLDAIDSGEEALGAWLDAQQLRARVLLDLGELDRANDVIAGAIAVADRDIDTEAALSARLLATDLALERGELERARQHALETHRRAGEDDRRGRKADALARLARLDLHAGDTAAASPRLRRALDIQRERGARRRVADLLAMMADAGELAGNYVEARDHLTAALDERRLLGDRSGEADLLERLGRLALDSGRIDEALAWLEEGLQAARERGERHIEARLVTSAARAHERGGRTSRAGEMQKHADRLWRSLDDDD
jgi:serine/threonine-protein kinase